MNLTKSNTQIREITGMKLVLFAFVFATVIAQDRDGYDVVNNYSSGPSTTEGTTTRKSKKTRPTKKPRPTKKNKTTKISTTTVKGLSLFIFK